MNYADQYFNLIKFVAKNYNLRFLLILCRKNIFIRCGTFDLNRCINHQMVNIYSNSEAKF